jgi:hypothetical protein
MTSLLVLARSQRAVRPRSRKGMTCRPVSVRSLRAAQQRLPSLLTLLLERVVVAAQELVRRSKVMMCPRGPALSRVLEWGLFRRDLTRQPALVLWLLEARPPLGSRMTSRPARVKQAALDWALRSKGMTSHQEPALWELQERAPRRRGPTSLLAAGQPSLAELDPVR